MLKFFMACLCFTSCLYSSITYQDCESVVDVISKETKAITAINPADHDELAKMHVSRGESYMLSEQSEKAIEDFEKALFHAEYSSDVELRWVTAFRAIFGKMISYDQLAIAEKAEYALEQLTSVVNYFQCDDRFSEFEFALNRVDSNDISIIRIAVDPNEPQPSWWCVNTVETTASVLMGIVANIRTGAVKVSATRLIGKLEQKAINCCYAGGLWSACIQPLADKLQQWLQKWKVFGIPPDPSWDSDL